MKIWFSGREFGCRLDSQYHQKKENLEPKSVIVTRPLRDSVQIGLSGETQPTLVCPLQLNCSMSLSELLNLSEPLFIQLSTEL
jgi:hypothetical protein